MHFFMITAMQCVIYYSAAGIFHTATQVWTVEVFRINYSCNQYAHIDNITLKVFSPPNTHQRSKAHFLVITHGGEGQMQLVR